VARNSNAAIITPVAISPGSTYKAVNEKKSQNKKMIIRNRYASERFIAS